MQPLLQTSVYGLGLSTYWTKAILRQWGLWTYSGAQNSCRKSPNVRVLPQVTASCAAFTKWWCWMKMFLKWSIFLWKSDACCYVLTRKSANRGGDPFEVGTVYMHYVTSTFRPLLVTGVIQGWQGFGATQCWMVTLFFCQGIYNLKVLLTRKGPSNIHSCLKICRTVNSQLKSLSAWKLDMYIDACSVQLKHHSKSETNFPRYLTVRHIVVSYTYRFFYMWQAWLSCDMGQAFYHGFQTTKWTMYLDQRGRNVSSQLSLCFSEMVICVSLHHG